MKRIISLLLALTLLVGIMPTALAADVVGNPAGPDHVIINQVYGGSTDGYASHSFIELYNPTGAAVDLTGWSIQYRSSESGSHSDQWYKLDLTGTIAAGGYYLIRCGEITDTTNKKYDVPAGNKEWNIQLHNKGLSVALVSNQELLSVQGDVTALGDTGIVDLAAVQGNDAKTAQVPYAYEASYAALQSKKKAIRRVDFADTDNNAADFEAVDYSGTVSADKQPHVGATDPGTPAEPDIPQEPTYTPVVTGDTRVNGYYDATGSLQLELAGRYNSGAMNADGGSLEIVQYNPVNGFAYAVSGVKGKLIAVDLNGNLDGDKVVSLTGTEYDLKTMVSAESFTYGDMTSVAISPDGSKLAVAIQAEDYTAKGRVALFTCSEDGSLTFEKAIETGVQPDMVTFTPDGSYILTANEGEPRMGYGETITDPAGSVTIINVSTGSANTVGFSAYDTEEARAELVDAGIVLKKDTAPSVDLEPEYIACTDTTAYVSLQEANAIAVLDIAEKNFKGIYSVGFEDYSQIAIDIDKKDEEYEPKTYDSLRGIRMPDGISLVTMGGVDYLLTANEGDSREWGDYLNESEVNFGKNKTSPTGNITAQNSNLTGKVVFFDSSGYDGLDLTKDYLFGGRSFTLFQVTENGLEEVFDSGNDFEAKTASYLSDYFNCSNDDLTKDDRSGKKGPEPETVVTGTVGDNTYAFIALERIGGVMVYDITDPANAAFVNYINSREFDAAIQGDVSPEGLCFISSADSKSGKALLLAACEVSGTLAVYELTSTVEEPEPEPEPESPAVPVIPSYRVTLPADLAGGTVTLNRTYAPAGSTVTITAVPEEGYALKSLTVTDAKGSELALTDLGGGKYSFRMPSGKVTVTAEFTEIEQPVENPFEDVTDEDYYYEAVQWAVANGITEGTSDSTFSPEKICTRAEIVTFLWRAAGSPRAEAEEMPFTDVPREAYYYEAVLWAVANGITEGTSDSTFSPEDPCTRAQGLTMLWRAMQAPVTGAADTFRDVAADAYYAGAVRWAVAQGVTNGTGADTFSPDQNCTRAQIVTFLWRAMAK